MVTGITFIAFLCIPTALFMIWHRLGKLNEHRQASSITRSVAEKRHSEPTRPSPVRSDVQRVVEAVGEKLVVPALKSPPQEPPAEKRELVAIARQLDSLVRKPEIREEPDRLFLLINHESKGPFSSREVLRRLQEKQLTPDTLCRPTDSMEWVPVETLTQDRAEDSCFVCGSPAGKADKDSTGKLVCAKCRSFMPPIVRQTNNDGKS